MHRVGMVVLALAACSSSKKAKAHADDPVPATGSGWQDSPSDRYVRLTVTAEGAKDAPRYQTELVHALAGNDVYPVLADGKIAYLGYDPASATTEATRAKPPRIDATVTIACVEAAGPLYNGPGGTGGASVVPRCDVTLSDRPKGGPPLHFAVVHTLENGELIWSTEGSAPPDIYQWSLGKYFGSDEMKHVGITVAVALGVLDHVDWLADGLSTAPPEVIAVAVEHVAQMKPENRPRVLVAARKFDDAAKLGDAGATALGNALRDLMFTSAEHTSMLKHLLAMDSPKAREQLAEAATLTNSFFDHDGNLALVDVMKRAEKWDALAFAARSSDKAVADAAKAALATKPK